ncbi:MAG: hypothetical protein MJZ16_13720 [Bacteroidales bacterium]|nr:hypothetical protein [Bacteroidales bacterium]
MMENETNEKYHISIGHGSWFNKVKQGSDNGKDGSISFWKIFLAILGAIGSIATVIGVLYSLNII